MRQKLGAQGRLARWSWVRTAVGFLDPHEIPGLQLPLITTMLGDWSNICTTHTIYTARTRNLI
ncbi:hypothetical protein [Streptomyces noursei]|uniref:Uncharacterized protein n=1 Tax=Streptomyces noursei TaxID=1971 RepID=A0A2N8PI82_STRNR|nr:hypothetical protein [Streptomyces noursei]PNE40680.1 hypothetical protein AOB60_07520 [Streptomyces noursei]